MEWLWNFTQLLELSVSIRSLQNPKPTNRQTSAKNKKDSYLCELQAQHFLHPQVKLICIIIFQDILILRLCNRSAIQSFRNRTFKSSSFSNILTHDWSFIHTQWAWNINRISLNLWLNFGYLAILQITTFIKSVLIMTKCLITSVL